jgi:uncharacterized phage-like protein YoqJ
VNSVVTISITGHRPEQLDNIDWVTESLKEVFLSLHPELIYQGMAAGVDLLSAEIAIELNLPYVAARPWITHTARNEDNELYNTVLKNAFRIDIVDTADEYPGPWVYHKRNEHMVDNADICVAVWNGTSKGGTAACVRYAKKKGKRIIQINPKTQTIDYGLPEEEKDDSENMLF